MLVFMKCIIFPRKHLLEPRTSPVKFSITIYHIARPWLNSENQLFQMWTLVNWETGNGKGKSPSEVKWSENDYSKLIFCNSATQKVERYVDTVKFVSWRIIYNIFIIWYNETRRLSVFPNSEKIVSAGGEWPWDIHQFAWYNFEVLLYSDHETRDFLLSVL